MKIAAVTDDADPRSGTDLRSGTISAHFGRATKYLVVTVEDGQITDSELRDKANHHDFHQEESGHDHLLIQPAGYKESPGHGHGRHSAEKHKRMFETITDCQIVLARGMGQGAYTGLEQMGIRPILTDIKEISPAVQAVIDGTIEDHPERLH
jgi:predicted Fe-Mo cluster-binding NifX family protein